MCNPPGARFVANRHRGRADPSGPGVCSAARQNNELKVVAMTICLCHGGICELNIRCSWLLEAMGILGLTSL